MTDIVVQFWKDYYEADMLKRMELLKQTHLVKQALESNMLSMINDTEEHKHLREHAIIQMFMSYFDDLIDFMLSSEVQK